MQKPHLLENWITMHQEQLRNQQWNKGKIMIHKLLDYFKILNKWNFMAR